MSTEASRRLFDLATRQALYIDAYKAGLAGDFNPYAKQISELLRTQVGRVTAKTMGELSKYQLNDLIGRLRKAQLKIYGVYTDKLLNQLRDFTAVNLAMSKQIYATAFAREHDVIDDEEILDDDQSDEVMQTANDNSVIVPWFGLAAGLGAARAWTSVTNTPIGANGLYLGPFVKGFTVSAIAGVENAIRKAWANKLSVEETVALLVNEDLVQGSASQVRKVRAQAAAVIATAAQHTAVLVTGAVASVMFGRYVWVSVIDSRTSDICRGLNRKIFVYGAGPVPPAHPHCRSHIVPIPEGAAFTGGLLLSEWLAEQPQDVQDDFDEISENDTSDDESKYTSRPMSLEEFAKKVKLILQN